MSRFSASIDFQKSVLSAWIFLITTTYLMSQALDVYLFHFWLDIHLVVVAMVLMLLGLIPIIWREVPQCLHSLKFLALILTGWILYLFVNAAMGFNWLTSIIFLFRFIMAVLIAFEIGVCLHTRGNSARYAMFSALLASFAAITLIWYLRYIDPEFLADLVPLLRDFKFHPVESGPRAQGLYVNPNILGFALVIHTAVLIWYGMKNKFLSLVISPTIWLVSLWGVIRTQSRNALIGMVSAGIFALLSYYKEHLSAAPKKNRVLSAVLFLTILASSTLLIIQHNPARWAKTLNQIATTDWRNLNERVIKQKIRQIDAARIEIWKGALRSWEQRPWVGIGLGCFQYVPLPERHFYHAHNFLLNLLVEQGLIGSAFLAAFLAVLVKQMKDWKGIGILACFLFVQLFEDETTSAALPIYMSLILGYCFYLALQKRSSDMV
ncbi:MAG: O-antigen ligase family protein [Desulfoferrobacter sp.]